MSDSLIQLPAMASGASLAGTCFMHTIIFTEFSFYLGFLLGVNAILTGATDLKFGCARLSSALRFLGQNRIQASE
jgi:hypothetical protein